MTGPAMTAGDNDVLRRLAGALALAELVVDKLPQTPSRTIPPALIARAIAGAVSARAVTGEKNDRYLAMALGAAAAVGAAYAGAAFRGALAKRHVPALAGALLEDGVAIGLGYYVSPRS